MPRPTGLQKTVIELPFAAGVNNKLSEEVRPPEAFQSIINADLTKVGTIKRRTGHTPLPTTSLGPDAGTFLNVRKLSARGDAVVALAEESKAFGSGWGVGSAGDVIYTYSETLEGWKAHAKAIRPTLECKLAFTEGWNANAPDCAVNSDGIAALAWIDAVGNGFINGPAVRLIDLATMSVVCETERFTDGLPNFTTAIQCLTIGTKIYLIWNAGGIRCAVYDSSSHDSGWSTSVLFANGIDFCAATDGTFLYIAATDSTSSPLRLAILRFTSSLGASGSTFSGAAIADARAYSIDAAHGVLDVVIAEDRYIYYEQFGSGLSQIVSRTQILDETSTQVERVSVTTTGATECWVFRWFTGVFTDPPDAEQQPMIRWVRVDTSTGTPVTGTTKFLAGAALAGHTFTLSGRVFMPVVGVDGERSSRDYYSRHGYALAEIDTESPGAVGATCMPVAAWSTDVSYAHLTGSGGGITLYCPLGCVRDNKWYFVSQEFMDNGGITAVGNFKFIEVDFAHPKRWESREFKNMTVFASALPFAFDGSFSHESGFIWRPRILSTEVVSGGTLVADNEYFFRAVYTFFDEVSNRWYSAPSYATEFGDAEASATPTGTDLTINLTVRPCSFTGMWNGGQLQRLRPRIELYMTTTQGGTDEYIFVGAVEQNVHSSEYATFSINAEPSLDNWRIYTTGGELENTCPPPCLAIERHRDRLFAISTFDGHLWYTKPLQLDRGVEWVYAQRIPIPSKGIALCSVEAALLVLCEDGIYALEGYGPSPTGQPVDAFARLTLLTADVGVLETNGAIHTPAGALFRAKQGWHIVTKTLELKYIGAPMEGYEATIANLDRTKSMDVDQEYGCVRILFQQETDEFHIVNYWYDTNRWSWDVLDETTVFYDAHMVNAKYHLLSQDVVMYKDFGGRDAALPFYAMDILTGWIRFENLDQFKRLWRVFVTVRPGASPVGLRVRIYLDWERATPVVDEHFTQTEIVLGEATKTLRVHMPRQKFRAVQVRLTEEQATVGGNPIPNTDGLEVLGIGFEIGLKRGGPKEPALRTR